MTVSLTAESLDLHGVNKVVFDCLAEQVVVSRIYAHGEARAGWVCGHVLRLPHVGGEAKHSRIAEIRMALRPYMPSGADPIPKRATTCGVCRYEAEEAKAAGRKSARVYAYRISPELHHLVSEGNWQGRAA